MIDLAQALRVLTEAGVEFVIVGGVAAAAHGSAMVTFDLHFCYARDAENLQRLVTGLRPCHPHLRGAPEGLPFLWDPHTLKNGLNFTLTTTLGDIDLLGEISGVGGYPEALGNSRFMEILGAKCRVLTLDSLIAAKRAADRPKDRQAVLELEALREAQARTP